jgi:hypothetical protein
MQVSCACSTLVREQELAPQFVKLLCDLSRWVGYQHNSIHILFNNNRLSPNV